MENIKSNLDHKSNLDNFKTFHQNRQINKTMKMLIQKEKNQTIQAINNDKENVSKKTHEKTSGNQNINNSIHKYYDSNALLKSTEVNFQNNTLENASLQSNLNSTYEDLGQKKNISLSNRKENSNNSVKNLFRLNTNNKNNNNNLNGNINFNNIVSNVDINNGNSTSNHFRNSTTKKIGVIFSNKPSSKNKRIPKEENNIRNKVFSSVTANKLSFRLNEKSEFNCESNKNLKKNIQNGNISYKKNANNNENRNSSNKSNNIKKFYL